MCHDSKEDLLRVNKKERIAKINKEKTQDLPELTYRMKIDLPTHWSKTQ